uniref:Cellular communication network factor 1, like 2 n=1 Tax=Denticeps clupeoides TaxID=299321 RepID=A0AAY4EHZ1_9TELE
MQTIRRKIQKAYNKYLAISDFCRLIYILITVQCGCPQKCSQCPSPPPSCPLGISLVLDSCGCCKVCARQYNQDCSLNEPCDHIKSLRCHLGAGGDPERGLCRAEALGRPCEFNGHVYQHGEDFQPSCQHQCSCMDGVVGCMPLCPNSIPLPSWHCTRPRLTRLPGRCCEEWVCDDNNQIEEDADHLGLGPDLPRHPNLANNELLVAPGPWDSSVGAPNQGSIKTKCFLQTTEWSPCSATCGMGVSSRITNSNPECQLSRETRLCQIRQCDLDRTSTLKRGKKCQRTVRPRKPVRISFAGCWTTQRYRPRSCGSCSDGRCCEPSVTRTIQLHFHCPEGQEDFLRNVMWIQRCSCNQSCKSLGVASHSDSLTLPNDIHTFTH